MHNTSLQSQLGQFESQLAFLSAAVLDSQTSDLPGAANGMQSLAVAISSATPQWAALLRNNHQDQLRVRAIAAKLATLRAALSRRQVAVDRALAALIPASEAATYVSKTSFAGRSPYGSAGRQSGEFKVVSA